VHGSAQVSHEVISHNYAPFNAAVAKYVAKLEQPDPRAAGQAFREKARGVGHVLRSLGVAALLALIGASLVVLCQQRNAAAPVESGSRDLPKPPIGAPVLPTPGPEPVATNYTLFTTVRVAEGVDVVTGWKFANSTDEKPDNQYCYLSIPQDLGTRDIHLAQLSESGALVRQSSPSAFSSVVREIDYETALSKCRWFPG
jgi:hypothetical protein